MKENPIVAINPLSIGIIYNNLRIPKRDFDWEKWRVILFIEI
jgi:hypothetical protein